MPVVPADGREPPIGALVVDRDGHEHIRTPIGWQDSGIGGKPSRTFVGPWAEFVRWYGPIQWNGQVKA